MMRFRVLVAAIFLVILVYTLQVSAVHGWDLVPIFFAAIGAMTWQGQFNVDFSCFLILSGLWTAWRNDYSPLGLILAPVAVFGGALFLSAYLLVMSFQVQGNLLALLIGGRRAALRG